MCEHKSRYLLSICSATLWTKESSSLFSLWEYTLWILMTFLTFSVAPVCTQCRMSEKWKTVETQVSCIRPTYIWKHIPPDDLVAAISVFLQSTGKPDNRTSFPYTSGYDGIKYIRRGQWIKIFFLNSIHTRFNVPHANSLWQGFGREETTGVASLRRCQKLPAVSEWANASWLQEGPATGQGQQQW